eukprot:COSAG02_NODE_25355_length_661_cov_0.722420_2_plen_43_part_01
MLRLPRAEIGWRSGSSSPGKILCDSYFVDEGAAAAAYASACSE